MKKNLLSAGLILTAALLFSSCSKKDWSCDCSYEVDAIFFTLTETESETYEKVNEEDAQADCDAFGVTVRNTAPMATCTLTELD